ncbi:hypothetical protein D9611_003206 [Ephemerocybe angulata]|uniref:Uncharacterized protein n=1 Tax=Ephemerocybe angulata TaxID=980116 RepID=A0A8H5C9X0_9AGAR|nr:hypothetical protein D9611_003206 [Tulosesus angulatus]
MIEEKDVLRIINPRSIQANAASWYSPSKDLEVVSEVMLPHIFISSTFTKVTFKRAKPLEYHLRGVAEQVICIVLAAIKARVYPINE